MNLDPLVNVDNDRFPLRKKLLANPKRRTRYLQNIRHIAEHSLSWKVMGEQVSQLRALIKDEVALDTRKLATTEAFEKATSDQTPAAPGSLREFSEKRSHYLLNHKDIKSLSKEKPKTRRF